jgi:hypothetical protein
LKKYYDISMFNVFILENKRQKNKDFNKRKRLEMEYYF